MASLFGQPPADPVPGQVWVSAWNGEKMFVSSVGYTAGGLLIIETEYPIKGDIFAPAGTTIPRPYAYSIRDWRRNIKRERRALVRA